MLDEPESVPSEKGDQKINAVSGFDFVCKYLRKGGLATRVDKKIIVGEGNERKLGRTLSEHSSVNCGQTLDRNLDQVAVVQGTIRETLSQQPQDFVADLRLHLWTISFIDCNENSPENIRRVLRQPNMRISRIGGFNTRGRSFLVEPLDSFREFAS